MADHAVKLPLAASDSDILMIVRRWCEKLVMEDYDAALSIVKHQAYMTPALLRTLVETYGSPDPPVEGEHRYKVTPLESARYRPGDEPVNNPFPRHIVERNPDEVRAPIEVWFDMPLDGYWSDLTAIFDVVQEDGMLVLMFDDLHVM